MKSYRNMNETSILAVMAAIDAIGNQLPHLQETIGLLHTLIDLQKTSLAGFAKEKKYEIAAEFEDNGKSGKKIDNRPGFLECLKYIETAKPAALLVYMVDRIGRFADRQDRNRVLAVLKASETSVDGPEDGLFRHGEDDDFDELEKMLNESRRDNERRAKRVHAGHKQRRLAGGWSGGQLPYGIRYDKQTKKFGLPSRAPPIARALPDREIDELSFS